jgi:hypothetical protein
MVIALEVGRRVAGIESRILRLQSRQAGAGTGAVSDREDRKTRGREREEEKKEEKK